MEQFLFPSRLLFPFILILAILQPFNLLQAQTYMNLSRGDSLSPTGKVSSISSPSGLFTFGFRPVNTNSTKYLLSIWYNTSSSQPIIWYAMNGATAALALVGSALVFTGVGAFYLTDSTSTVLWNPNTNGISQAMLLDTGNFVLYDRGDVPEWQSFAHLTNTLVPCQIIGSELILWSRLIDLDFSRGRFTLAPQSDGSLVLYAMSLTTGERYQPLWGNGRPNGTQLVFNLSGALYYHLKNDTGMRVTSSANYPSSDYYQHATLDPNGNFRLYAINKSANATWAVAGQLLTDGGVCGFNAYCNSDNKNQTRLECECPPHYSFADPENKYKGCMPDHAFPSCQAYQSNEFRFSVLQNTDWSGGNLSLLSSVNEDQCKEECLKDCDCAVVVILTNGCWKKGLSLSSGQQDVSNLVIIGSVLVSCLVVIFVISGLLIFFYSCNKKKPTTATTNLCALEHDLCACSNMRAYTCKELDHAAKGFCEELGRGAFSTVYKGILES